MKKKKLVRHRNANAKALALPKFRAKVIPNKKKEYKMKYKKFEPNNHPTPVTL